MSRSLSRLMVIFYIGPLILTSFVTWGVPQARAASNAPIDSVVISGSSQHRLEHIVAQILKNAYAKAGIRFRWDALPNLRSLVEANAGGYDGVTARVPGASSQYPNLIAVPNPVFAIVGRAYTIGVKRDIRSWSDLKGLHVAVVRGEVYAKMGTENVERTFVTSYRQLFQILASGKADVAIGIDTESEIYIAKYFADKGIHATGDSIFRAPLHHLVHKKNAYLVPQLNKIIRTMTDDGSLAEITRQAIQKQIED